MHTVIRESFWNANDLETLVSTYIPHSDGSISRAGVDIVSVTKISLCMIDASVTDLLVKLDTVDAIGVTVQIDGHSITVAPVCVNLFPCSVHCSPTLVETLVVTNTLTSHHEW